MSDTQKLRNAIQEALVDTLGRVYDCTRVWEAWSVGTMTRDDFIAVTDQDERVYEITEAIVEAVSAVAGIIPEPTPSLPLMLEEAGYTRWGGSPPTGNPYPPGVSEETIVSCVFANGQQHGGVAQSFGWNHSEYNPDTRIIAYRWATGRTNTEARRATPREELVAGNALIDSVIQIVERVWEHQIRCDNAIDEITDLVRAERAKAPLDLGVPFNVTVQEAEKILEEWPEGLEEIEASRAGWQRIAVGFEARALATEALVREFVSLEDQKLRLQHLHLMGHGTDYDAYHKGLRAAWTQARIIAAGFKPEPNPISEYLTTHGLALHDALTSLKFLASDECRLESISYYDHEIKALQIALGYKKEGGNGR